jgi:branched-subunit amino acid aminotransferase/4-amino-4-deoxychorismate lyase
MKYALHDGNLIPEGEALLPLRQREVLMSFGVYESLKVRGGKALFVEEHIERLQESSRILELEHPFELDHFVEGLRKLIEANGTEEATIRIELFGGDTPFYYAFCSPLPHYPREYYSEGVEAITYPGERIIPEAKSSCLLLNYMARREAARRGALEALFLGRDGTVPEGARSNLFACRDGKIFTPERGVLKGVTRRHILEACEKMKIEVVFDTLCRDEIFGGSFDGLFISSTSMGAIPLKKIDGHSAFSGPEGMKHLVALTERLNSFLAARELEEQRG